MLTGNLKATFSILGHTLCCNKGDRGSDIANVNGSELSVIDGQTEELGIFDLLSV